MALADEPTLAPRAARGPSDPAKVVRAGPGGSLLGLLIGRGLSKLASWFAPLGRYSLYVGLLLVALTVLRLPGGNGGVADVFLFVSMVCALLVMAQGQVLWIGLLKVHAVGVALVIGGVTIGTLAQSTDEAQSLLGIAKFLFATSATIVTCMVLLVRRRHLKIALGCWVISAAITSAAALLPHLLGDMLLIDAPARRAEGLTPEANHLGAVAGMAIGGALCLAVLSGRMTRAFWLLAALLCIFGVVASASRSGAVIALASVGLWAAAFYRSHKELTVLVAGGCLAGAAVASFVYVQLWGGLDLTDRLARATDPSADRPITTRLEQYELTLTQSLRSPLVGVGLAGRHAAVEVAPVHNTLLMLFRAGGLLALVGIVVIFADLVHKGVVTYRQARTPATEVLLVAFLIGVVGLLLDAQIEPVLYQRQYWVPSALLLASIACRHRAGRSGSRRASRSSRRGDSHRGKVARSRASGRPDREQSARGYARS